MIKQSVVAVYADLLDFCRKARLIFLHPDGTPRSCTVLEHSKLLLIISRQGTNPFAHSYVSSGSLSKQVLEQSVPISTAISTFCYMLRKLSC
jgi:hypothetical protein